MMVDGYNVIHARDDLYDILESKGLEAARNALCGRIARMSGISGSVTVVFDGDSGTNMPHRTMIGSIKAVFSTSDSSADDEMVRLLEKHPHPDAVTVITADNDVATRAAALRATAVAPEDFFKAMAALEPVESDEPREKFNGPGPDEMKYWLGQFKDVDGIEQNE